jgi:DNA-binding CsgD family transcriptional regulator
VNTAVYNGARRAGCTPRESELLAVYVESEKMANAALELGISLHTAKNTMTKVYRRLDVGHAAAAVARVMSA